MKRELNDVVIIGAGHTCSQTEIGELFKNKSDELVLAFDAIINLTEPWKPNTSGAAKHSIVFHSKRAWLIVKPMKSELDLKFYLDTELESEVFRKVTDFFGKYAHHIRIKNEQDLNKEVVDLLRIRLDNIIY
jgi:hypothetical protein